MTIEGGCRCGAIRYAIEGDPAHHALCLCNECRKSAGAAMIGWALFDRTQVTITGETTRYNSSGDAIRQFCPTCGTGLFYSSESVFPGKIDVQTATFDDPDAVPPQALIQVADAPAWFKEVMTLPQFARYPEQ